MAKTITQKQRGFEKRERLENDKLLGKEKKRRKKYSKKTSELTKNN